MILDSYTVVTMACLVSAKHAGREAGTKGLRMRYERPTVERATLVGSMLTRLSFCRIYPEKCDDR